MTKNELFEQEQNNPALFEQLDKIILNYQSLKNDRDDKYNGNWFSSESFLKGASNVESEGLLEILVDIGIAQVKDGNSVFRGHIYKIKSQYQNSTSLSEQFKNWKQDQKDLKPKGDNIIGSIVFKDSPVENSQLQLGRDNLSESPITPANNHPQPNQNNGPAIGLLNVIKFIAKNIVIPLLVIMIALYIEYKYIKLIPWGE